MLAPFGPVTFQTDAASTAGRATKAMSRRPNARKNMEWENTRCS
jgi:hypothetical protein